MKKKCKGCGELLQSHNKELKGYLPENKMKSKLDDIVCMRCFRLKHYGENFEKTEDNEIYKMEVKKAVKMADIVLAIFDILDFESSFTDEIKDLLEDKTSIVVINKMDLLPKYLHVSEVSKWVSYYLTENNIFAQDLAFISAKNKYGVNGIFRKIQYIAKSVLKRKMDSEIKIAVIGVSNVGKSNLINLLLDKNVNTVSKFSGTTKKIIENKKRTKEFKLTIIDTPGLIPEGRLSDLLNSNMSHKLVPSSEIPRKTFKFKENQVFMFSNLAYLNIKEVSGSSATVSVFASRNVKFHITNMDKVENLMNNRTFFKLLDEENFEKYMKNEFETKEFNLTKYTDLVISGLGYIEAKDNDISLSVTVPKGVKVLTRKSISKFANFEDEDEFDDLMW